MLLVSQAVDQAVGRLDFTPLAGKSVYLDTLNVDKALVDRGYVLSSVRQQLLAAGALLRDEPRDAIYCVELRIGAVGTDRNNVLVGTPAVTLPAMLPGVPTAIPEIALMKKTDQKGIAKIGVYAYNRVTGRSVWQSGVVEEVSTLKDLWVFGAGPYSHGSIRKRTELAGETLPHIPVPFGPQHPAAGEAEARPGVAVNDLHTWTNGDSPPPVQPIPAAFLTVVGTAAVADRPLLK